MDPIICARCWYGWSLGGTFGPAVGHPVPLPLIQDALHPLSISSPLVLGLLWDGLCYGLCQCVLHPIQGWDAHVT
eukprot:2290880-Karenia_brevis.AAC.1